ncbi:type II toxin-antitoxin system VapB family antitoxin [Methylobacterium sp. Leaf108]|uniref:antitoxin n=1 Tax=Methylobacterium sp. Leaf108 TaxID=1736256 RepID=UPI000700557B|nr:type II toxin-antitoxin system VapB family antitoxin [Methylobacterium sp. Leaf108]KQP54998.1 AbrB family transcriptional regulator [Methylobacterium sp. Leaf108]
MGDIAKVFWSGRSQAVRLPKEFRFDAAAVRIRREGDAVILEPLVGDEWAWLKTIGPIDDDVIAAIEEDVPQQERPELDTAFECSTSSTPMSSSLS